MSMTFTEFLAVFAGVIIGTLSATYALAALGKWIDRRPDAKTAKTSAPKEAPAPIGHIECYCGEEMPIYGDVEIMGEPGQQTATISVDTSALWLHSFEKHPNAHKEEA